MRQQPGEAIVHARKTAGLFPSMEDLVARVPSLNRGELTLLASIGSLNSLDGVVHRRDALWQAKRAGKLEGPLFSQTSEFLREDPSFTPLQQMTTEERLAVDYAGTGLTVGSTRWPTEERSYGGYDVLSADELKDHSDGRSVRAAGCVIAQDGTLVSPSQWRTPILAKSAPRLPKHHELTLFP